jgi:hypothetical protein
MAGCALDFVSNIFLHKFLHFSTCIVNSGLHVGKASIFISVLGLEYLKPSLELLLEIILMTLARCRRLFRSADPGKLQFIIKNDQPEI